MEISKVKKSDNQQQFTKKSCKSCGYELNVEEFYNNRAICKECFKNKQKERKNKCVKTEAVQNEEAAKLDQINNQVKSSEVITPDEKNTPIEENKSHKLDDKSSFENKNVQIDPIKVDEIKTNNKIKQEEHLENSISKQQKSIPDKIIHDCMNYIQEHKFNSGLGPWFDNLCLPLLQKSVVVITPEILRWLGFSKDHLESEVELSSNRQSEECNKDDMDKFLELLRNNSIEYIELKHNNQLASTSAYIQSEIKYLKTKASEKISSKVWIAMKINCFRDAIMKLDFSSNIRCIFAYLENKVNDYDREALQQTLKSEQQKNIRLTDFVMNAKAIENNEWLYIATTKNYVSQQIFKVGSTKRLAKRINSYQTGRLSSDEYYYVNVFKCSNGTEVDRMVRYHLKSFKASKLPSTERKRASSEDLTELYVINYKYLVKIVTSIVEGFNKTVENINEYIIEFPNLFEEVEIPAPLPKSVWMKY